MSGMSDLLIAMDEAIERMVIGINAYREEGGDVYNDNATDEIRMKFYECVREVADINLRECKCCKTKNAQLISGIISREIDY